MAYLGVIPASRLLTLIPEQDLSGNYTFDLGTLYIDSGNNRVGINNTSPTQTLTVTGNVSISGNLTVGTGTTIITNDSIFVGNNTSNVQITSEGIQNNGAPFSPIPSGTKMLFVQSTAPTGWTKSTTHDNKALRVVSGAASSGGTVAFTTAFASQAVSGTVGSTTLTTTQMPSHNHGQNVSANPNTGGPGIRLDYDLDSSGLTAYPQGISTDYAGGSQSHNHSFTGTAINLAVQYVDVIIATKD